MMRFLFFNAAGTVLFERSDAEKASVTHEEMSFRAVFPYDKAKEILRGMRIGYEDAAGSYQVFEARKVRTLEPDHYQEITAENIAISELTDEFTEKKEITNKTVAQVLPSLLTNTGWAVGTNTTSNQSSGDISTGDVWSATRTIQQNWNVYIIPRITVNSTGITHKYLDVMPAEGTWRGFRLSLDKNANEVGVIWDDSKLKTALYGFGQEKNGTPLTFKNVVWTTSGGDPANKPANQTYVEDASATSNYGRNGRPRFGYYQNASITDAATLLEKTWEVLQTVSIPDVTVSASVTDLHRLGYVDVPLRLHDTALVEVRPTGVVLQKEIVQYTEDLLDPLQSRLTIGTYIPNIIYINRENNRRSGGGRGSGSSQTLQEYTTENNTVQINIDSNGLNSLCVGTGAQLDENGNLVVDEYGNPVFVDGYDNLYSRIVQNATNISLEVTRATAQEGTLSGRISVEAGKISQIVQAVGDDGEVTAASIVAAINDGASSVVISADHIELDGDTVASILYGKQVEVNQIDAGTADFGTLDVETRVTVNGTLSVIDSATFQDVDIQDGLTVDAITLNGRAVNVVDASVSGNVLTITKANGSTITFSKATTLNGGWSSGVYTVTARQNQTDVATDTTSLTVTGHWGNASNNESTTTYYGDIKATRNSSATIYDTGKTFTVNASALAGIDSITKNAQSTNPRDYDSWSGSSIGTLEEDTYYQIKATPNAGAAGFIKFKTAASSGGQSGIASVSAGGWVYANNVYTNTVTAVANDGTSDAVDVGLPTISCQVGTGTSDNATIRPYGPGSHILSTGTSLTLYLKSDNDYVYLTNANATPAVGTNVVARATNTKAGPETVTITSATRTAQGDDSSVISGTDGTLGSAGYKYFVVTATASNGATRTIGINAEPTYTAGYNAAPVGIPHDTSLLTWSASSNDSSVYSGWSSVDSISTGGYQYRQYYVTASNGDTAYIKVNASSTYTAGYNAAPVGIPNNCVVHVGYSNEASDYNDWTAVDTLSMSSYKYKLIKVVANDGTEKYVKIHADGTYNAGADNALANGGDNVSLGSSTNHSSVGAGHNSRNVTGYIWYKDSSGAWKRMKNANGTYRSFSINATNLSARVYRLNSDDEYEPYPANNLIWTW